MSTSIVVKSRDSGRVLFEVAPIKSKTANLIYLPVFDENFEVYIKDNGIYSNMEWMCKVLRWNSLDICVKSTLVNLFETACKVPQKEALPMMLTSLASAVGQFKEKYPNEQIETYAFARSAINNDKHVYLFIFGETNAIMFRLFYVWVDKKTVRNTNIDDHVVVLPFQIGVTIKDSNGYMLTSEAGSYFFCTNTNVLFKGDQMLLCKVNELITLEDIRGRDECVL